MTLDPITIFNKYDFDEQEPPSSVAGVVEALRHIAEDVSEADYIVHCAIQEIEGKQSSITPNEMDDTGERHVMVFLRYQKPII